MAEDYQSPAERLASSILSATPYWKEMSGARFVARNWHYGAMYELHLAVKYRGQKIAATVTVEGVLFRGQREPRTNPPGAPIIRALCGALIATAHMIAEHNGEDRDG